MHLHAYMNYLLIAYSCIYCAYCAEDSCLVITILTRSCGHGFGLKNVLKINSTFESNTHPYIPQRATIPIQRLSNRVCCNNYGQRIKKMMKQSPIFARLLQMLSRSEKRSTTTLNENSITANLLLRVLTRPIWTMHQIIMTIKLQ